MLPLHSADVDPLFSSSSSGASPSPLAVPPPHNTPQHRSLASALPSSYPSSSSSASSYKQPSYSRVDLLQPSSMSGGGVGTPSSGPPILPFIMRMFSPSQMDYQSALDQMASIATFKPQKVYKTSYYRKQTKNRWSRDDPAFLFLLLCFHLMSSLIYGLSFNLSFLGFLVSTFKSLFLSFLLPGLVLSPLFRHYCNTRLRVLRSHSVPQDVELLYAFDIHLNGSVPLFLILHPLQFLLLPLLLSRGFLPLLLSTALHVAALSSYLYVTHLGYRALPFLQGTEAFLSPLGGVLALGALSLLLAATGVANINASRITCWLFYE